VRPSIRFEVYRTALLRGTGFDAGALIRLGASGQLDYDQALEHALASLRAAFADPRLREAVAISNPGFYDIAFAEGRPLHTEVPYKLLNKRARRQVRTAHRYLRRLLAKTETNAFFGPTLVVRWDQSQDAPMHLGPPAHERTIIGLSHWVVTQFAAMLRRELPPAERAWRRNPLWRLQDQRLVNVLSGDRIELDEESKETWRLLAEPSPAAAAGPALRRIAPALRPWPEPPATLIDGAAWLTATYQDAELPTRFTKYLDAAARSPWPESHRLRAQIRDLVAEYGVATSRQAGAHYADRDVINEDRASPWSGAVTFGRPAVDSLRQALATIVPLMLLAGLLRQHDARMAVRRATGGASTGLVELAARDIHPASDGMNRLTHVLESLVPDDPACEVVHLDPGVFDELWDLITPPESDVAACLPGFDLMLAGGPPGTGQWVLAECHDDCSSAIGGITSRARPRGDEDFGRFCRILANWLDTDRMATIVGRRRSRHITPELPGLSIELSGVSGKPRCQVAAAADVTVAPGGDRVVYDGHARQLYPGDVPSTLFTALSLPCLTPVAFAPERAVVPRIVLGDIVVQRRRFKLELPEAGRGERGWRAVTGWRSQAGLPGQVFLRHPDEPKPLFIDFDDPLTADDLNRLRPAPVLCTEVLPALTDTWWNTAGKQPAELRVPVLIGWDLINGGRAG
jgi:hypothetical protein